MISELSSLLFSSVNPMSQHMAQVDRKPVIKETDENRPSQSKEIGFSSASQQASQERAISPPLLSAGSAAQNYNQNQAANVYQQGNNASPLHPFGGILA